METITYRQFNTAVTRAVNESLRKHGKSLSIASISTNSRLIPYGAKIEEIREDEKTMKVSGDWRTALRLAAQSFSE